MAASTNPNGLKNVLPNAGGGFAVKGDEIAANTIGDDNIQLGILTSASMNQNLLKLATITLTAAQIKTLYSVPTLCIAAPGAGKSIIVLQALARFLYTAPAFTSGGAIALQYDNTVHAGGVAVLNTLAAAVIQGTADVDTLLTGAGAVVTAAKNKGIYASCATADFATGTAAALTFYIYYQIL